MLSKTLMSATRLDRQCVKPVCLSSLQERKKEEGETLFLGL